MGAWETVRPGGKIVIKLFCKHSWIIIDKTVQDSEVDQLTKIGLQPNTHSSFSKRITIILACNKCGKLQRFVDK